VSYTPGVCLLVQNPKHGHLTSRNRKFCMASEGRKTCHLADLICKPRLATGKWSAIYGLH